MILATMIDMHFTYLETPIGKLRLFATDAGLSRVEHVNQQSLLGTEYFHDTHAQHPVLASATKQLGEYIHGNRIHFDTPLHPLNELGTHFQHEAWKSLLSIPHGETTTYLSIATMIGRPKAVRAVGTAIGRNPLSIFIPCHRVIGKNGKLTGYAGGLQQKKILLELEKKSQTQ